MERVLKDIRVPQRAVRRAVPKTVDAERDGAGGSHGGVFEDLLVFCGGDVEAVDDALPGISHQHGLVRKGTQPIEIARLGNRFDQATLRWGDGEIDAVYPLAANDGEEVGGVLDDSRKAGDAGDGEGRGGGFGDGVDGDESGGVHVCCEDVPRGTHGEVFDGGEADDLSCLGLSGTHGGCVSAREADGREEEEGGEGEHGE